MAVTLAGRPKAYLVDNRQFCVKCTDLHGRQFGYATTIAMQDFDKESFMCVVCGVEGDQ